MQRIRLLKSQKILLQMKSEKVQEAIALAQARQKEVQATLNLSMIEVGVSEDELKLWKLSEDGQSIEKAEPPKDKDGKKGKK
jgi:collagenase-like PrtC family protease